MKRNWWTLVTAAALAVATPAWAGEEILFGPPPEWVVQRAAAPDIIPDPDLPVVLLSLDSQVRSEGGRHETYSTSRVKFLAAQGLTAGNLSFGWRPETDDFTVHRVLIHRDGETIDVLGEGQTFTVLRREQNLEQAMLDGTLTANLFPDGLEVGDVLEFSTTLVTRNPVTGEHAETMVGPLNFAAGRVDITLSWPTGTPMRLDRSDDLPEWKRSRRRGYEFAELGLTDLLPVVPPRGAPARFALARLAQATDYASWNEVAQLFAPLYAQASAIPAEGPLRNEVEKIRAASEDPVLRAEMALALVQERVRYVALLDGLGALMPASAAETWARRYGDCKGKTALLMGILAELGIDSEAVLVSTVLGEAIGEWLPAVGLFDHVILHAAIDGRDYWLDGTRTGDASLARIEVPYFGWALPLRMGPTELVRLIPPPPAEPTEELAIEFDAREGLYGKVPARIEMTFRGDAAIGVNNTLSQLTGPQRDRGLREFWRGRLNFVEPESVSSAYDAATGELRLTLAGTAKMDWDDGWYETDYTRVGYRADFSREAGPGNDAPFAMGYPSFDRTRQTILLPPEFTAESVRGDSDIDETIAGMHFYRRATLEDGRFFIERSDRALAPEVSAAEARAAERRLRDLWDKRVHLRLPANYRPTEADIAAVTGKDGNADLMLGVANMLLDQGRPGEALPIYAKMIEADPDHEWAWANRALALVYTGDLSGAEDAAARAEKIAPANYVVWHARGLAAAFKRDHEAAIAAYSKAIDLKPGNDWALMQRILANFEIGRFEDSTADARRYQQLRSDSSFGYAMESAGLFRLGREEEGARGIERLIERFADNPAAQAAAGELMVGHGLEDHAGSLLDSAEGARAKARALLNVASRRTREERGQKIADLTRALELDPTLVPALISRADTYWMEYKMELAMADADAAIALAPDASMAYNVKAEVLMDLKRPAEAAKVADSLVEAAPDDAQALAFAAQIYMKASNRTKARRAMARAKEIAPDHPMVTGLYDYIMNY